MAPRTPPARVDASRAPIYVLVSIVPEAFGGMVTAALQRSSAFAELKGRRVEVLTKSAEMGDPLLRTTVLHETGQLSPRVRIRNIWSEILSLPDKRLAEFRSDLDPLLPVAERLLEADGSGAVHRGNDDGTVLQTDRFRPDGSRALSDVQDWNERGTRGGRLLTLFTRQGRPIAQWRSLRALYHAWVDFVVGDEEAFVIVDSAPTGGLFFDYQRENVTLVQVLHTLHMFQMRSDQRGRIKPDVMQMLTHLDWFDGVAILTSGQQQALISAGVVGNNSFVAPNMLVSPTPDGSVTRARERGTVVARLVPMKRIGDAVAAVARIVRTGTPVDLDIFGEGPETLRLQRLIRELGVDECVRLRGHDPHAKDSFAGATFTILTSRYEGLSLVLLEAMSAGCIPIAYDVPYGPGDIITDSVNGFLVPDGDVDALVAAVERLMKMPEEDLERMRRAAIGRALDFSPTRVLDVWERNLEEARRRKSAIRSVPAIAFLRDLTISPEGIDLTVTVPGAGRRGTSAKVAWIGRRGEAFGRVDADVVPFPGGYRIEAHISHDRLGPPRPGVVLDVYLDFYGDKAYSRTRLTCTDTDLPGPLSGWAPYRTQGGNLSIRNEMDPGDQVGSGKTV